MKLKKVCDIEYDDELDVIILVEFDQSTWTRNDLRAAVTAERDRMRKKLVMADQFISILRNSGDDEDEYWAQRFYNVLYAALDKDA